MAKIIEEVIIIKVSKLSKDDATPTLSANDEIVAALAQVAEELLGNGVVVEVERA